MSSERSSLRLFVRTILRESSGDIGSDLVPPEYGWPAEIKPGSEESLKLLQRALGARETGLYDYQTEKAWDDLVHTSGKIRDTDIEGATTLELATDWKVNSGKIRKFHNMPRKYTPGFKGMLKFVLDFRQFENEDPEPYEVPTTCTMSQCFLPGGSPTEATVDALNPVPERDVLDVYDDAPPERPTKPQEKSDLPTTLIGIAPGKKIRGGVNFDKVKDEKNNYRAALGDSKIVHSVQFFQDLYDHYGIRNVVTLNADDGGKNIPGLVRQVIQRAGQPEMKSIYIPSGRHDMPNESEWSTIKNALDQGNTIIHCARGADRTGGVVARWYIETGRMTYDEAIENMRKHKSREPYDEIKAFARKGCDAPGARCN